MRARILAVVLAWGSLASGCEHPEPSGTTTLRSGVPGGARRTNTSPDDPRSRVATELCRRAEACGRVGRRDKRWPTLGACVADLEGEPAPHLGCPSEPSRRRLDACLAAIRSAACDAAVDGGGALPDCRAERLCQDGRP